MTSTTGSSSDGDALAEIFARHLVERIRDSAVLDTLAMADGEIRGAIGEQWDAASADERVAMAAAYGVDSAIGALLTAIENRSLELWWRADDGQLIDVASMSSGDLTGMFVTNGGWRDRYTAQVAFPFH